MTTPGLHPVERSRRRLATLAVVALAAAACLGLARDASGTAERGNATVAVSRHHHVSASIHLDGVAAVVAVAFVAQLWATERSGRIRMYVPATPSLVRRRGPPRLLAY